MKDYIENYYEMVKEVMAIINDYSQHTKIVIFDPEQIDDDNRDEIYGYPYAYYVDKYEGYNPGVVSSVDKGWANVVFTGEIGGDMSMSLGELPFESLLEILDCIKE